MSEQCRDWTRIANPGQSVGWRCNTHGDGSYVGDASPYLCRIGRAEETERVLTDLITDVRGASAELQHDPITGSMLETFAHVAEARLKDLNHE